MNLTHPRDALIARFGLVATGAYLLLAAELSKWTSGLTPDDDVVIGEMFLYLLSFAFFLTAALASDLLRHAGKLALAGVLIGLLVSFYSTIAGIGQGNYFFDVMPMTHRSAEMILDGENPYSIRGDEEFIRETARRYNAPLFTFTREGDGELIDQLVTYPAGHVLPFLPGVALGLDDLRWITLFALFGVIGAIWLVAPPYLRPVVALPAVINTVFVWGVSLGGLTDVTWLLPLMGMVYALHQRRLGWAAVFYGVATSMRQQTWLLAPFLLIWLWRTGDQSLDAGERLKPIASLSAVSAAVFLLINLPFIIWNPADWLHGVTYLVFTDHGIWGVGIASIRFLGLEPGQTFFTVLTFAVLCVLVVLYATRFDSMQHAVWIFPALILWFIQRPLWYYFIPWFLLLLFALLLTSRPAVEDELEPEERLRIPAEV